jgi:hypothetical protein
MSQPAQSPFDPSSLTWDDEPAPATPPASQASDGDRHGPASTTSANADAARERGNTRDHRLGGFGLVLAVAGSIVLAAALWMSLESITISADPLGNAPKWLAVGLVSLAVLVASVVLGVFALVLRRGRGLATLALVTALVIAPILVGVATTLGADDLQGRARQQLKNGAGVGIERVVKALGEMGVPEGPVRTLLGE